MLKFKRNQRGITLVALVITIIVLLILAGISVTTLVGENGIISRATNASEKQKENAALEEVKLAIEAVKINKILEGKIITLEVFTEESGVVGRNVLENELYAGDSNTKVLLNDDVLNVYYKSYEFNFDGNLSVTVDKSEKIVVTPTIKSASLSSLTISSNVEGLDDLSQIVSRYYSCDGGQTWKDGGEGEEYIYNGLMAETTYNVKVKIRLKNNKEITSNSLPGVTQSLSTYIANIPDGFFTTNATGDTITGINSQYKSNSRITYNQADPTKEFDGILVIPSEWKGVAVKNIDSEAFSYIYNIQKLYIDEGIKTLGSSAFRNSTALTEVSLPTTIESIDTSNGSFCACANITKVTIPKRIASSKDLSLYLVFGDSADKIIEVNYNVKENDPITVIGEALFRDCESLTNINIPSTVTEIGKNAFQRCKGLTSITIPANVEKICDNAFSECSQLSSITLQDGLKEIEWEVFYGCDCLESIVIPSTVETMYGSWDGTFHGCNNLKNITVKKAKDSIVGAPWAAPNMDADDVVWQPEI